MDLLDWLLLRVVLQENIGALRDGQGGFLMVDVVRKVRKEVGLLNGQVGFFFRALTDRTIVNHVDKLVSIGFLVLRRGRRGGVNLVRVRPSACERLLSEYKDNLCVSRVRLSLSEFDLLRELLDDIDGLLVEYKKYVFWHDTFGVKP